MFGLLVLTDGAREVASFCVVSGIACIPQQCTRASLAQGHLKYISSADRGLAARSTVTSCNGFMNKFLINVTYKDATVKRHGPAPRWIS